MTILTQIIFYEIV